MTDIKAAELVREKLDSVMTGDPVACQDVVDLVKAMQEVVDWSRRGLDYTVPASLSERRQRDTLQTLDQLVEKRR